MRLSTLAVAAGLGLLALTGAALADTFHDRQNRISATTPAGWRLVDQSTADHAYLVLGSAANECDIFAVPRPEWASITPAAARHSASQPITPENWVTVSNNWLTGSTATTGLNGPATFVSQSVDDQSFFPSQRAEMTAAGGEKFHVAHLVRPGLEVFTYCVTFSGADNMSIYDGVIRSISTPNDAQWKAEAEAAPPAPAAPATPTPPPAHH